MRRDPRLHGLSSQHHHALVLARSLARASKGWTREQGLALGERFDAELEPHFRIEEELLLPALRVADESALADRTAADHAALREFVAAARAGDGDAARGFGERLVEHIRFEERELFPACEARLADAVLEQVSRLAPR